jgi:hypothetical protein
MLYIALIQFLAYSLIGATFYATLSLYLQPWLLSDGSEV